MVRIVKVPQEMRSHFSANQLSGWPNGVQYSPSAAKRKRRKSRLKKREVHHLQAKEVNLGGQDLEII